MMAPITSPIPGSIKSNKLAKVKKLSLEQKVWALLKRLRKLNSKKAVEYEKLFLEYKDSITFDEIETFIKVLEEEIREEKEYYRLIRKAMLEEDKDADYWDNWEAKEGLKELY